MADWVTAAREGEVQPGQVKVVAAGPRRLALCNVDGEYYCIDDVCTHDGGPLSDGPIDPQACTIACPRHGAKFDLRTGAAVTMPATRPTRAHEVRVAGDQVFVRLSSD